MRREVLACARPPRAIVRSADDFATIVRAPDEIVLPGDDHSPIVP
jgi:hypothetical protein